MFGKRSRRNVRVAVRDVEVHPLVPGALQLRVDGAGDDVPRRQVLHLVVALHEGFAGLGSQDAPFAAHRLADQRGLGLGVVEAGGVELYELHVGHGRPRPVHGRVGNWNHLQQTVIVTGLPGGNRQLTGDVHPESGCPNQGDIPAVITLTVTDNDGNSAQAVYLQGSAPGTGPDPGGSLPSSTRTPTPEPSPSPSPTPAGGGSAAPAGGGAATAKDPTPFATAPPASETADEEDEDGGGNALATTAGVLSLAIGGGLLGAAAGGPRVPFLDRPERRAGDETEQHATDEESDEPPTDEPPADEPPRAGGGAGGVPAARPERRAGDRTAEQEPIKISADLMPEAEPERAPLPAPRLTINSGGRSAESLHSRERFSLDFELPRAQAEDFGDKITVKIESTAGDTRTVTLVSERNERGPVRYHSGNFSFEDGGWGSDHSIILGFAVPAGGLHAMDIENAGTVTFTIGEGDDQIKEQIDSYDTHVQQDLARFMESIRVRARFWARLGEELNRLPANAEGVAELRAAIAQHSALAERAENVLTLDALDTQMLGRIQAYAELMARGSWSRSDVLNTNNRGNRLAADYSEGSFYRGIGQAAIGLYDAVATATPGGSMWTLFTGTDTRGRAASWDQRVLAAVELAGWVTLVPGTHSAIGAAADMGQGMGRASRGASRVRRTGDPDVLRAVAGTVVDWPEEFGMLRHAAAHFQSVATRFGIRIRIRPANMASLEWLAQGHPPKHVKLKTKTINEIDELLGAPPGHRGQVGFFESELPSRQMFDEPTWRRILQRHSQRRMELQDYRAGLESLQDQGLVRLENGLVVDTGLSNTRLIDGQLVHVGGNPAGIGLPYAGDYDMWDMLMPDGSAPSPQLVARVERELAGGAANTQHGGFRFWQPQTDGDRTVFQAIVESHGGTAGADGRVMANAGSEALMEFAPPAPGSTGPPRPIVSYSQPTDAALGGGQ